MTEKPRQGESATVKNEQKGEHNLLKKIGAGLVVIVVLAAIVVGLSWYVDPSDATEKTDFIQAVAVFLAGLAGLGGLYFTSQNLKQTRENTEKQLQQAQENTDKQIQQAREDQERIQELTEQGQITDRFTRAIEHLGAADENGNERLEMRLGGIYALERIATDSPERDYSTVMEVLTAYVRENARLTLELSSTPTSGSSDVQTPQGAEETDIQNSQTPRADIRAILDVLRRRDESSVPAKSRVRLDLRHTDLAGADLGKFDLRRAVLIGANLTGAYLYEANLYEANLTGADLYKADLKGIKLEKAGLDKANLNGANLTRANLNGAFLIGANLNGADLTGAHLRLASLNGARLLGTQLKNANLFAAHLSSGARLNQSYLIEAGLISGDGSSPPFLDGANLSGATGLVQRQIEDAIGDDKTKLPEGLDRPAAWSMDFTDQMNQLHGR